MLLSALIYGLMGASTALEVWPPLPFYVLPVDTQQPKKIIGQVFFFTIMGKAHLLQQFFGQVFGFFGQGNFMFFGMQQRLSHHDLESL